MGQSGGPKLPADGLKTSYDFGNITSYSAAGSLKDMISGINLTLNNSPTISGILSSIVATLTELHKLQLQHLCLALQVLMPEH